MVRAPPWGVPHRLRENYNRMVGGSRGSQVERRSKSWRPNTTTRMMISPRTPTCGTYRCRHVRSTKGPLPEPRAGMEVPKDLVQGLCHSHSLTLCQIQPKSLPLSILRNYLPRDTACHRGSHPCTALLLLPTTSKPFETRERSRGRLPCLICQKRHEY